MLFRNAVKQKELYEPERIPSKLGYKGFLLQAGKKGADVLILGDKTKELQEVLLQSIPKELISNDLMVGIFTEIKEGGTLPDEIIADPGLQKSETKRGAPPPYSWWTKLVWNNFFIRTRNNCYNYANDKITNTIAQPGLANGIVLNPLLRPLTAIDVEAAATADGLARLNPQPAPGSVGLAAIPASPNEHLVALVVAPGK